MPLYNLIIDSHVHLYRDFDLSHLFSSAFNNMAAFSDTVSQGTTPVYLLGLTLTEQEFSWAELLVYARQGKKIVGKGGNWTLVECDDELLLNAQSDTGESLYLLCGYQLVSSDNLELLVLGSNQPSYDTSQNLAWHIAENQTECLVLPWAVGKWLGKRGKIVSEILAQSTSSLRLGDNGGRTSIWSYIQQFKLAKKLGVAIWPGTDPLPLAGQERLVGSNAILLPGVTLQQLSGQAINKVLVESQAEDIKVQQQLQNFFVFIINQLKLRLK